MELLGPILEIVNNICTPIGKCLKFHRSLDENMENLKRKLEELNSRKGDIESKMKVEICSGKNPKEEVEFWLREVQRINGEIQTIEVQVERGKFLSRARLGKCVAKKIREVEELHQKGSFYDGLVVDALPCKGSILPTTKVVGETTAKRKMEEIWQCLINDDDRKVGVYGMGGSGKTTIMKHINNRILENTTKEFDRVKWVTVSKPLNVIKLQKDIASAFNADISKYEDETTRATELFNILIKNKKYLLIFDNLWEAFHLEVVGIPEPTLANGCKIVLITRSRDLCRRMNCKDIKMELLSDREAWNLFLDNVGYDVLCTPGIEEIAKLVAKECARLPLAIITIAGSMKGVVDECEWRNALEELTESTKELNEMGKVLRQLKSSYNRLENEMHRRCLLHCALYPEDYAIERMELIERLIIEGIIKGMRSRQAEFNKGHSILNKLENACLLESCTNNMDEKCVKMHDLIRDMALQIMGRGYMVEAGVQLRELPNEEQWTEDLKRVSLMNNHISEIPSCASPRCSGLLTLLLLRNNTLERIPGSFFVHMRRLKVLDLSYTSIENLPNSISDLKNLTALLLRRCWRLKDVPSLAKLQTLMTLDLSYSGIEEVPQGMEMLVNLKCLNLKAGHLKILPAGILHKLSRLQCLIVWWDSKTLKVKGEEVAGLRKLETFAGQLYNLHDFNIYVRSMEGRGPMKYLLQLGPGKPDVYTNGQGSDSKCGIIVLPWAEPHKDFSKYVGLRKCSIGKGGEDPLVLPNDIKFLSIEECHDVSSLLDVSSSSSSNCTPLQSLEVLLLKSLWNLRVLFRGEATSPPPPGTFSCLKKLEIYHCPNIKKLFTLRLLPLLRNLEDIEVRYCEGMEEIIAAKAQGEEKEEEEQGMGESSNHYIANNDDTITRITLPKLRLLSLRGLPELKSIVCSSGVMVCESLQKITVYRCTQLKRLPLSLSMRNGHLSPPPSLKCIHAGREWWESLEWDHPTAKDVLQSFLV